MTDQHATATAIALPVALDPSALKASDAVNAASVAALFEELLWTLPATLSVETRYEGPLGEEHPCGFIALFRDEADLTRARDRVLSLLAATPEFSDAGLTVGLPQRVAPDDWAHAWKRFWGVTPITPTLIIRPSWEPYDAKAGETVITLDPGCAFGTGAHETTRLMLEAMESLARGLDFHRLRVLDVGCGSGVLAVVAALWGAQDVTAIDIEPEAIRATHENARVNGVERAVHASTTLIADLPLTPYDLILANIQAPVILAMLNEMRQRLRPDGALLLSGLIESSVGLVRDSLTDDAWYDVAQRQQGDWFSLIARRTA